LLNVDQKFTLNNVHEVRQVMRCIKEGKLDVNTLNYEQKPKIRPLSCLSHQERENREVNIEGYDKRKVAIDKDLSFYLFEKEGELPRYILQRKNLGGKGELWNIHGKDGLINRESLLNFVKDWDKEMNILQEEKTVEKKTSRKM